MNIRDDLKAFVDNELSPERASEVQAAIDHDPALRQEVQFMKQISGEIKNVARDPIVQGLDKAVAGAKAPRATFTGLKWGGLAAASIGGLFLIGLIGTAVFPLFAQSKMATKQSQVLDGLAGNSAAKMDSGADTSATPAEEQSAQEPETSKAKDGVAAGTAGKPFSQHVTANGVDLSATKKSWSGERSQDWEAPNIGRQVIKNADMSVKVKSVREAMASTEGQVTSIGGIVEDTHYNEGENSSTGTIQFQVPESKFSSMLDYLRKLGTVTSETVGGKDVTAEIANTDGRIHALADEEHNLIEELQKARNMDTRLEIRSRLSGVRQEMEGLKSVNKATKNLAEMSRMSLTFQQSGQLDEGKPSDWFNQTTDGASNVLGFFGRLVGIGAIYVVFLSPIWLPIVGIVWWTKKRAKSAPKE